MVFALLLIALPPLAYVIWLVRRGELDDIHMPVRETRLKPLSVMLAWILVCAFMLQKWNAPALSTCSCWLCCCRLAS